MKGVNIFLADGFEDMEALATNDILRRAGIKVNLVSIDELPFVRSSHGITVSADALLDDLDPSADGVDGTDVMIFPGGMPGSKNLAACGKLMAMMQEHYDAGGSVAAICAAPGLVLGQLRNLDGVRFTCFDGFEAVPVSKGAVFELKPAVTCGRIITGRSAGHAVAFALEIVRNLAPEKLESVSSGLFLVTE